MVIAVIHYFGCSGSKCVEVSELGRVGTEREVYRMR